VIARAGGGSQFGLRLRLPALLQAPDEPPGIPAVRVDDASPRRFALRVLFAAKRFTFPAALLLVGHMAGEALVPVIVGIVIDRAIATSDLTQLLWWLGALAIDFLFLSFAFRFGSRIGLYGMQQVQHRLRSQVADRLLHPAGVDHGQQDGAALSIATSDVARLAAVMQIGVYPVGEAAAVILASIALFSLSPPLGLGVALGAAALTVGMFTAGGPLQRRSLDQQALAADSVNRAADLLAGYRVLKGLRAEAEASARYRETSRTALVGTLRAKSALGVYEGVLSGFSGVFVASLTVLAGVLALSGQISIGGLIAAIGLVQFVVGPLTAMPAHTGRIWAVALASSARVLSVLQAPEATATTGTDAPGPREAGSGSPAQLDNGRRIPALDMRLPGFALQVLPGECIGIVAGQAVAGRIVRLLAARLRSHESGEARLDGSGPAQLGLREWRRRMVVAPHRAELFDGTIAWNLDVPGTDPATASAALHAAACDDLIAALPQGIETPVGEGGTRLSGGQRQRVALARAYATRAPVLVLHEPTTAVDAATEQLIADRLRRVRGGRSTVLVTSSPTLLAVCDRVVTVGPRRNDGEAP
jgi:ABC-type multidrug transport system fused ATPase/permease subunit